MKRFLTFEKRMAGTAGNVVAVRIVSIAAALLAAVLFLLAIGKTPQQVGDVLGAMFVTTFISPYGFLDVLTKSIPLIITAIGISLAFKMKLWNIGGEGQIAIGAFAAAGVAMLFPGLPGIVLLPLMAAAAMAAGALWATLAAAPRAYLGVNETITTLMLNYVALMWLQYLITGPWRDPASKGFPIAPPVPQGGEFPVASFSLPFLEGELHMGILIALALAVAFYFLLARSRWGYEIRVIGESPRAAEYAGINVRRNTLLVMAISGAIAGLAGMNEVAGVAHRLEMSISGNYGYTAIIIAWLARLNPWGIVAMSVFMSALLIGGDYAQATGIPASISIIIQGMILFFVLGFDLFSQYRIRFHFMKRSERA